jgi:uncharacterized protein YdaL
VGAGEVDEVYQDDELPCSFNIDSNSALEYLLGDDNDVTVPEERIHKLSKEKSNIRYLTFFVFHITFLIFHTIFLLFHIMFLIFHIMFFLHTHLCLFLTGCRKS